MLFEYFLDCHDDRGRKFDRPVFLKQKTNKEQFLKPEPNVLFFVLYIPRDNTMGSKFPLLFYRCLAFILPSEGRACLLVRLYQCVCMSCYTVLCVTILAILVTAL